MCNSTLKARSNFLNNNDLQEKREKAATAQNKKAQQMERAAAAVGRTSVTRERLVAANRDDSAAERELLDEALRVLHAFTPTQKITTNADDDDDDNNNLGATIAGLRTCTRPHPKQFALSLFLFTLLFLLFSFRQAGL
jgi:hypothetical protein